MCTSSIPITAPSLSPSLSPFRHHCVSLPTIHFPARSGLHLSAQLQLGAGGFSSSYPHLASGKRCHADLLQDEEWQGYFLSLPASISPKMSSLLDFRTLMGHCVFQRTANTVLSDHQSDIPSWCEVQVSPSFGWLKSVRGCISRHVVQCLPAVMGTCTCVSAEYHQYEQWVDG